PNTKHSRLGAVRAHRHSRRGRRAWSHFLRARSDDPTPSTSRPREGGEPTMATDVNFEVSELHSDGVPVLAVRGEVDVATAPQLRERLLALADQNPVVVVADLTEVTFIDSTALGVLVSGAK